MFGEKPIIGVSKITIDSKNRFSPPKYALAKTNDKIIFTLKNDYYLDLWNSDELFTLENIKKELLNNSEFNQDKYDLLCEKINDIYQNAMGETKVDSYGRIRIPLSATKELGIEHVTLFQGFGEFGRVYKSYEAYNSIKRTRNAD